MPTQTTHFHKYSTLKNKNISSNCFACNSTNPTGPTTTFSTPLPVASCSGMTAMPIKFSNRYAWIPLVCSAGWFITLLVMILTWIGQSRPYYVSQNGTFPFISDIGADVLKPWFIIGCTFTGISFFLTLFSERWLRHRGRLQQNSHKNQKILAICAIIAAGVGGIALILLSVFDTKRYETLHRLFLGVFMLGVVLSAIFTVVQYAFMTKLSPIAERSKIRISSTAKAVVATFLIGAAAGMAVCLSTRRYNAGAYLEWVIAFGFTIYPLTFWIDLRETEPRAALNALERGETLNNDRTFGDHVSIQEMGIPDR